MRKEMERNIQAQGKRGNTARKWERETGKQDAKENGGNRSEGEPRRGGRESSVALREICKGRRLRENKADNEINKIRRKVERNGQEEGKGGNTVREKENREM